MHDNDPEVSPWPPTDNSQPERTYPLQLLEREKHRNLTQSQHKTSTPHKKDAPGWNEYLASASEANVKVRNDFRTNAQLMIIPM